MEGERAIHMAIEKAELIETECAYKYKFSVIVPVYNTEPYLEETKEL